MEEKIFILDTNNSGFVAVKPGTTEIINFNRGYYLFRNKILLESCIERENVKDYEIYFYLDNEDEKIGLVPYDSCQKVGEYYQYFHNDSIVSIVPTTREKVFKCGYISFGEDPTERITDYMEGKNINKDLYLKVKEACAYLLRSGKFKYSIKDDDMLPSDNSISPFKYGVYNYALNIRIMRGFELVKINEFRKRCMENALPFKGELDKYKNIYFCFCKDENEFKQFKIYNEIADDILKEIISYIEIHYPDTPVSLDNINFYYPVNL